MSAPRLEEFPAFFKSIHGHDPFLWQQRLLREVVEEKRWPRVIAAPTGAGKTAVLDIALFHLAMEARKGAGRTAPVRICFAVDRRIIVDQAFDRAAKIRRSLAAAADPTLSRVAEALSAFGGHPFHVEQLRGGMPREDDWARTPAQPTILCTTVDQLGSRLLFRGYGASERMAPVHAGLLGEDCLILLDEAHLSQAFVETLANIERWRGARACGDSRRPWFFSALTATPKDGGERRFELSDAEKDEERIRARLNAQKTCELLEGGASFSANAFVEQAQRLAAETGRGDAVVAVVVNRVPFARAIFDMLMEKRGEDAAILLTGRVRPVERDQLIRGYRHRLFVGERGQAGRPLFVVATQCIEAGADFDFDALVTQIAPLDALRQRLGRLDRVGAKSPTRTVLIAARDEIAKSAKDDAIYGDRAKKTWEWLSDRAVGPGEVRTVDFGPGAMQRLIDADADGARACMADAKSAPILRGADLAFLSMTHPRPHPDPEISLFLRGELDRDTDVSIVWRADIEECFAEREDEEARREQLGAILDLAPPRAGEALRIPLWHARAWLRREHDAKAPLADVDSQAPQDAGARSERRLARRARGEKEGWEFVDASALRAGDTLIAPSSHGGCDRFGWAPQSTTPVDDIAEEAAAPYERRRAFLRLHPAVWKDVPEAVSDALSGYEGASARRLLSGAVKALRSALQSEDAALGLYKELSQRLARLRRFTGRGVKPRLERPYGETADAWRGAMIIAPRGIPPISGASAEAAGEAVTDDGDAGSFMRQREALRIHSGKVEGKARQFGIAAGLPARLVNTVARAGRLHDYGKADTRFQTYLVLADREGEPPEPLAKSGGGQPRGAADAALRRQANLPKVWRHEALSVRLAIAELGDTPRDDVDAELVVWLVGTHHGYGRPFFPHDDPWDDHARTLRAADGGEIALPAAPGPQRLDFEWRGMDWAQLFEALKSRYGVWGLAYLEAIVRLADHRASEEAEQRA